MYEVAKDEDEFIIEELEVDVDLEKDVEFLKKVSVRNKNNKMAAQCDGPNNPNAL